MEENKKQLTLSQRIKIEDMLNMRYLHSFMEKT